ncbi:MAG: hypothetical protein ACKO1O_05375 [Erythrobacter sp.]
MKVLRIIGVIGALALMLGEAYRTWGTGRPVYAWMDDMLVGGVMLIAAARMANPTLVNRTLFSAAWGMAVGMLYGSFFGKLFEPASSNPGNFGIGTLTVLVGLAFVIAIGGLVASIMLPQQEFD